MKLKRTLTICIQNDLDLRNTLDAFVSVQQEVSVIAFNDGNNFLSALDLHRKSYNDVKGKLNSQMTITALKYVSASYASAKSNYKRRIKNEAKRKAKGLRTKKVKQIGICNFNKPKAVFLVGNRGRDASFKKDNIMSIWTVSGRKKIPYTIPANFQYMWDNSSEIDSVTVIERNGKLYGRVCVTVEVPDTKGFIPIGVDLNQTNAIVATDSDNNSLFITGLSTRIKNKRTLQTIKRLTDKLTTHKAEGKDTRSIRRILKQLSHVRSLRTKDFCSVAAKKLCNWVPENSVLVLEDLSIVAPVKEDKLKKSTKRKLNLWPHAKVTAAIKNKAEMLGIPVEFINPAYTSQNCSRCGSRGNRNRHNFFCSNCNHSEHADINASKNIRHKFVQLRLDEAQSIASETLLI